LSFSYYLLHWITIITSSLSLHLFYFFFSDISLLAFFLLQIYFFISLIFTLLISSREERTHCSHYCFRPLHFFTTSYHWYFWRHYFHTLIFIFSFSLPFSSFHYWFSFFITFHISSYFHFIATLRQLTFHFRFSFSDYAYCRFISLLHISLHCFHFITLLLRFYFSLIFSLFLHIYYFVLYLLSSLFSFTFHYYAIDIDYFFHAIAPASFHFRRWYCKAAIAASLSRQIIFISSQVLPLFRLPAFRLPRCLPPGVGWLFHYWRFSAAAACFIIAIYILRHIGFFLSIFACFAIIDSVTALFAFFRCHWLSLAVFFHWYCRFH